MKSWVTWDQGQGLESNHGVVILNNLNLILTLLKNHNIKLKRHKCCYKIFSQNSDPETVHGFIFTIQGQLELVLHSDLFWVEESFELTMVHGDPLSSPSNGPNCKLILAAFLWTFDNIWTELDPTSSH